MIEHIFVDMDGVLCDFVSAAMKLYGQTFDPNNWPPGEWETATVLGLANQDELWEKINAGGSQWWYGLHAYPWANDLIAACRHHCQNVSILTKGKVSESFQGKHQWVQSDLRNPPPVIMVSHHEKHLCAGPRRILIDDSDKNIELWRNAGGIGILFPRVWNALHAMHHFPLVHVGMELQKIVTAFDAKAVVPPPPESDMTYRS